MSTTTSAEEWALSYSVETADVEDVDTYATRLQLAGPVDVSGLHQDYLDRKGAEQRMGEGQTRVPGPQTPELSFPMWAYGHGAAANGALTAKPLHTLLGMWLGNVDAAQVGGSLTSAGSVSAITSTNTTLKQAGLARVGVYSDARAKGVPTVLAGATSPYTLNVNLPGAPNSGDAIYAAVMVYPSQTKAIAQTKIARFLAQSGNYQWRTRGCFATSIKLSGLNEGELPRFDFGVSGMLFDFKAATFPSATATNDYAPGAVAGGGLVILPNNAGTRTNFEIAEPRDFTVDIKQDIYIVPGNGGTYPYRTRQGFVRRNCMAHVSVKIPSEAATTAPTWYDLARTNPNTVVPRRILWWSNTIDGSGLIFHAPRAILTEIPVQVVLDGMQYIQLELDCHTSLDTTNELTLASFCLGFF